MRKKNLLIIIAVVILVSISGWYIYNHLTSRSRSSTFSPSPLVAFSPSPSPLTEKIAMDFKVDGCQEQTQGKYSFHFPPSEYFQKFIEGRKIKVIQKLPYICCADLKIKVDSVEKRSDFTLIALKEINTKKEKCDCLCDYRVEVILGPLEKGNYLIHLYGIYSPDEEGKLLWGENFVIQ